MKQKKFSQDAMAESVSYLLAHVCKAHRGKGQEFLALVGLHPGQEMLMHRLWAGDGIPQSELASDLGISPATTTRMLDRMTKAGFLERRIDSDDQRVSRIYLTETGWSLQKPVAEIWQDLEERSLANLTHDERILLRRLLLQLLANLE